MRNFAEHAASLEELETFDGRAFVADSGYSQDLCNFFLSLALIYNDLHDIVLARDILEDGRPADTSIPTPHLGEYNGMALHLFRAQLATIHELVYLIEKSAKVIANAKFDRTLRQLNRKDRAAWQDVLSAIENQPGTKPLERLVFFARTKVASHYDQKEIAKGYKAAFLQSDGRVPFISRGSTMATSRFHFADAAAEEYMKTIANPADDESLMDDALGLVRNINVALFQLITRFISDRGCSWRKAKSRAV